jgi:hypothetical protein
LTDVVAFGFGMVGEMFASPQPWPVVAAAQKLRREFWHWVSRGRLGRRTGRPVVPRLPTPWQDTISAKRIGWRMRRQSQRRVRV